MFRVGWTAEPDSISPFIAYNISATEIFKLIYDPLVAFDNDVEPVGRLAKEWTISDDYLTWTFHLKEGIKWHDGEGFTAEDVKFTYEYLLESGLGLYADSLKGITSIKTPDDFTVIITTSEPKANMLQITTPILPKHIWEDVSKDELETWPNEKPIGTGAFEYVEFKTGEYIKLKANKDYFYQAPHIDELVFSLYANNDTMVQSLNIGEIDAAININPNQVELLEKEEDIEVIATSTHGFTELAMNSWKDPKSKGNPLLQDKAVRQAISYAIDRQKIIDVAYSGQGTVGSTLIPPSLEFWHYVPTVDEIMDNKPEKAKEILDEAGYKDTDNDEIRENAQGDKLHFRLFSRSKTSEEVRAGEMIASMLKEVGISLSIETVDDGLLSDRIYDNADFDMFIWGWGTDADPTTILTVLSSDHIGNLNDVYFSNEEYDKLLKKQAKTIDLDERQQVVYQMQQILYDESPYAIITYDNALQAVRTDKWEGWSKVGGVYFYSFNHANYLTLKPVQSEEASGSVNAESASSDDTSDASNRAVFGWIVGLIVFVLLILFLLRRRKKSTTIDSDM